MEETEEMSDRLKKDEGTKEIKNEKDEWRTKTSERIRT